MPKTEMARIMERLSRLERLVALHEAVRKAHELNLIVGSEVTVFEAEIVAVVEDLMAPPEEDAYQRQMKDAYEKRFR